MIKFGVCMLHLAWSLVVYSTVVDGTLRWQRSVMYAALVILRTV